MTSTATARITLADTKPAAAVSDALVIALAPGRGKKVEVVSPGLTAAVRTRLTEAFNAVGATGKPGNVAKVPGGSGVNAPVVVGVGLGDAAKQADPETLRRSVGEVIRSLAGTRRVSLALPIASDDDLLTVSIAALLAAYDHVAFRSTSKKDRKSPVTSITVLLAAAPTAEQKQAVKDITAVAAGVNLTRDLVNTPPNALPPAALAEAARDSLAALPVEVTIWDETQLAELQCGGILAVGMGSANPPRLTRLAYSPEGATTHLALVGKGITFDTGGISIKPAASMDEMKSDMAGAAAVLGAVAAIAELRLPVRVTGWLPSAENMPSGRAQRPGDVIVIRGGTTVEVLNTDAEGRLILSDGLTLAVESEPDAVIDLATLTGAAVVALGKDIAGLLGNDVELRDAVQAAGAAAGEPSWPLPLPEDYASHIESEVADMKNMGRPGQAGTISAALLLQEFVGDVPWAHLDIAGPSRTDDNRWYNTKGGSGFGVRTLVALATSEEFARWLATRPRN